MACEAWSSVKMNTMFGRVAVSAASTLPLNPHIKTRLASQTESCIGGVILEEGQGERPIGRPEK